MIVVVIMKLQGIMLYHQSIILAIMVIIKRSIVLLIMEVDTTMGEDITKRRDVV
jgi:hypothetical protein